MTNRLLRALAVSSFAWLFAACGGGGGDAPPAAVNQAPVARAGTDQAVLAGASVALDGGASADPEGAALSYHWSIAARPGGSVAALSDPSAAAPQFVADVAGTYRLELTVDDGSVGSAVAAVTIEAVGAEAFAIRTDAAEPLAGTVRVSLDGPAGATPVNWFVDLREVAQGTAFDWSTTGVTSAPHQVMARIRVAPGRFLDIRRTLTVSNSPITLGGSANGTNGLIGLRVDASSPAGIATVFASFEGASLGTLTAKNGCSRFCTSIPDYYAFTIDARGLASGTYSARVTVTDGAGETREIDVAVVVANAPVVSFAPSPDGRFFVGTMHVAGTVSSDRPGPVRLSAVLGDVEFLNTTDASFSADVDLHGLPDGMYTMQFFATDSFGLRTTLVQHIVAVSDPARAYQPLFQLGAGSVLLAAEGDWLLHADGAAAIHLKNTATDAEVALQGLGALTGLGHWQMDGGFVYATAQGGDCSGEGNCLYQWARDGSRRNLTAASPWPRTPFSLTPVARGGFVAWRNAEAGGRESFTLYDPAGGAFRRIDPPADAITAVRCAHDLGVAAGIARVAFYCDEGGTSRLDDQRAYLWSADTGIARRLASTSSYEAFTDGERVVWRQPGSIPIQPMLLSQLVGGGATSTVSDAALRFTLRDGVLAWEEVRNQIGNLKASTTSRATTFGPGLSAHALGGGTMIYGDAGALIAWSPASDARTLIARTLTEGVVLGGGQLYFTVAESQALYRVPLP